MHKLQELYPSENAHFPLTKSSEETKPAEQHLFEEEFPNLVPIYNARSDTALYELPPAKTGKRGCPRVRGKRLSLKDFTLKAGFMAGAVMSLIAYAKCLFLIVIADIWDSMVE